MSYHPADSDAATVTPGGQGRAGVVAEERTTDVAHYANVSRYVVQRKQTEPEAPTPYTLRATPPQLIHGRISK